MKPERGLTRILYLYYHHALCYFIVFATPNYFLFEMIVVRPTLIAAYNPDRLSVFLHTSLAVFLFVNVTGNMFMSMLVDTKLRRPSGEGKYCSSCRLEHAEGTWRCNTCECCVVRRDHHCHLLARCIGLQNRRYFMLFITHITISMIYSVYANYYFIRTMFDEFGIIMTILRAINPLFRYYRGFEERTSVQELYVVCFAFNIVFTGLFGFHFVTNINNVLKGVTMYESKTYKGGYSNWRRNFVEVFGTRWWWALVWPLANSPLPARTSLSHVTC